MFTILPRERADHAARDRLRDEEHRVEIGRHDLAPVSLGKIDDRRTLGHAGVVHQDVDWPDVLFDLRNGRFDGLLAGHIERSRERICTDRLRGRRHGARVPPIDDDARTRRHVAFRDGAADAAARAGDERKAAGEVEHFVHGGSFGRRGRACKVE